MNQLLWKMKQIFKKRMNQLLWKRKIFLWRIKIFKMKQDSIKFLENPEYLNIPMENEQLFWKVSMELLKENEFKVNEFIISFNEEEEEQEEEEVISN